MRKNRWQRWYQRIREDLRVITERDPAARQGWPVLLLTNPGLQAQWSYRLAHALWQQQHPLLAYLVAYLARAVTGIEIHPAATIGRRLFIDHGMGVVIGETATIGDDVTLFHGVTLGGTGKHRGKRHPTIGDRVTIGTGASILGPIVVAHDARIGANAVVLRDIPPEATAVGVPARLVTREPASIVAALPTVDEWQAVQERLAFLEEQVAHPAPAV